MPLKGLVGSEDSRPGECHHGKVRESLLRAVPALGSVIAFRQSQRVFLPLQPCSPSTSPVLGSRHDAVFLVRCRKGPVGFICRGDH